MRLNRPLKKGDIGEDVRLLQEKLRNAGFYKGSIDSVFSSSTEQSIMDFQKHINIKPDGKIGISTWNTILNWKGITESPKNIDQIGLNKVFISESGFKIYDNSKDFQIEKIPTSKDTIVLNLNITEDQTNYSLNWNKDIDGKDAIVTFTIGNKSKYDGVVFRNYDDNFWSYSLGTDIKSFNISSITIELLSDGWARNIDGKWMNKLGKEVESKDIVELELPYMGEKYWVKYTDSQLNSLGELLKYLSTKWDINLSFSYDANWFSSDSFNSTFGLRNATQLNKFRIGLFPQKELIDLLNSFVLTSDK